MTDYKRINTKKGEPVPQEHRRQHNVDNPYDHQIPDSRNWGKVQRVNPETGQWEWVDAIHPRLHSITSEADHAPAPQEHWGKYVRAEPGTGKIIFDDLPLQGVAIVLVEGMAGYIESNQHNLGADIQVDFYHVYLDGEETKRKPVEIHYDINSVGRIYWESSFILDSHIAVIK